MPVLSTLIDKVVEQSTRPRGATLDQLFGLLRERLDSFALVRDAWTWPTYNPMGVPPARSSELRSWLDPPDTPVDLERHVETIHQMTGNEPDEVWATLEAERVALERDWLACMRALLWLQLRFRLAAKRDYIGELRATWPGLVARAAHRLGRPVEPRDGYWEEDLAHFEARHRPLPSELRAFLLLVGRTFNPPRGEDHLTCIYGVPADFVSDDLLVFLNENQGAFSRAVRWGDTASNRVVLLEQMRTRVAWDPSTGETGERPIPWPEIAVTDPVALGYAFEGPPLGEYLEDLVGPP